MILKDNCTDNAVVSGRTLSFPVSLTPVMSWAAAGADLVMLDIAPGVTSTLGRTIKAKHNFVCTTHARVEVALLLPNDKGINSKNFLWCVDGINEKGLSVAVLYQSESKSKTGNTRLWCIRMLQQAHINTDTDTSGTSSLETTSKNAHSNGMMRTLKHVIVFSMHAASCCCAPAPAAQVS